MKRRTDEGAAEAKAIGERIRAAREERGLSQRGLASGICAATFVSRIEHGERRPRAGLLLQLAERLGATAAYLEHGEGLSERAQDLIRDLEDELPEGLSVTVVGKPKHT